MQSIELYKETCTTFRHYSQAALNIRLLFIAQSVILLSTFGYFFINNELKYAIFVAGFGIAFTYTLMILHQNYQRVCSTLVDCASEIEKKSTNLNIFPMHELNKSHTKSVKTIKGEIQIVNGMFYLMIASFIFLVVYAVILNAKN